MTTYRYDLYGSQTLELEDLEALVPQRLGLVFSAHNSSYWGLYSMWRDPAGDEIRITSNFVDEDGELLEEDFPTFRSFVHVSERLAPVAFAAQLLRIDGLQHLRTRTLER